MAAQPEAYRFGRFELRPSAHELYKQGAKLRLRPQAFHVLRVLVERPGEVITREDLRKLLWNEETFVDFDQSLNTCIKEIRAALNDSAADPQYIETLPKLGYRMVAQVKCVDDEPMAAAPGEPFLAPAPAAAAERPPVEDDPAPAGLLERRWRSTSALVAIGLIVALAGYAAWLGLRKRRVEAAHGRAMLAVLPFDNLTGDSEQEYFSDGLTEEVITQLGGVNPQKLGVIARTSVMRYKRTQEPLAQIGRELGVQYVLEGTVRRDAEKVRVSAQLIQLRDQTQLWSREYDRELSDLLALQDEMGREMADELRSALGEPASSVAGARVVPGPSSSEAYDLYLKGLESWNKRTIPGFQQAIAFYQQAIAKDPGYARAYAGLADSYALLGEYSETPETEFMPKARAAALRALALDDSLPEAHTALALVVQNYDWDWRTSEREFRRAIELDPNYATAHHWYAEHLMWEGRFDEALAESERARELDPLSLIIAADRGAILYYARQYDGAIAQFQGVLQTDPTFPRAYMIINAYAQKGRFADALTEIDRARRMRGEEAFVWMEASYVYGRSGGESQARHALTQLQNLRGRQPIDPESVLWAEIGVGDKEKAFASLQEAYLQHSTAMTSLKVEPAYDPLRGDPRYQQLLRRVNLDQ